MLRKEDCRCKNVNENVLPFVILRGLMRSIIIASSQNKTGRFLQAETGQSSPTRFKSQFKIRKQFS